jgi:hypothetical protein
VVRRLRRRTLALTLTLTLTLNPNPLTLTLVRSVARNERLHTLITASTGGSIMVWDPRVPAKPVQHAPRAHSDAIAGLQSDEHKVSRGLDSLA